MPRGGLLIALFVLAPAAFADDVAAEAQRAKQAMLAGHYSEAVSLYRRMAVQLPEEPSVRFNLALALHSLGRYGESTKILEGMQAASNRNPKFWFLLGEGHLRLGAAKDAVAALRRAEELSPTDFDTSKELASAYLESGQFAEAERKFHRLTEAHVDIPLVWAGLALSETGLGNSEAAEEAKAQLEALPDSAGKFEMLARLASRAGQGTEAIEELHAAQKLKPGDGEIESALARALIRNRQFEEATSILKSLLARDLDNAGWQFDYGDALLGMGEAADAISHLQRAVALSPGLLPAQAKLGEALLQTGSAAAAVHHLELAAPIDKDGSIHFQLATAYRKSGKPELAAKAAAISKSLSKKP